MFMLKKIQFLFWIIKFSSYKFWSGVQLNHFISCMSTCSIESQYSANPSCCNISRISSTFTFSVPSHEYPSNLLSWMNSFNWDSFWKVTMYFDYWNTLKTRDRLNLWYYTDCGNSSLKPSNCRKERPFSNTKRFVLKGILWNIPSFSIETCTWNVVIRLGS